MFASVFYVLVSLNASNGPNLSVNVDLEVDAESCKDLKFRIDWEREGCKEQREKDRTPTECSDLTAEVEFLREQRSEAHSAHLECVRQNPQKTHLCLDLLQDSIRLGELLAQKQRELQCCLDTYRTPEQMDQADENYDRCLRENVDPWKDIYEQLCSPQKHIDVSLSSQ